MKKSIATLALAAALAGATYTAVAQDAGADDASVPKHGGMMQKDMHPMMTDCRAMMSSMLERMESEQMQGDMREMMSAMGPRMQQCHELMSNMLENMDTGAAEQ